MAFPALYSSPTIAKRSGSLSSIQSARTPASAYATEQRLLRAYADLLYSPSTDVEELMRQVWGSSLTPIQMYGFSPRVGTAKTGKKVEFSRTGFIDQLDELIPELIRSMRPEEQPGLCALLLNGLPQLAQAVQYALSMVQKIKTREDDPNLKLSDNAQVAGLGRISSENYGRHRIGNVSFASANRSQQATPEEMLAQSQSVSQPTAPAPRVLPPAQLRPKPRTLQAQVKKAQERKRLKRKRR